MQIAFGKGQGGWKQVPIFHFADWKITLRDQHHLAFKPSGEVWLRRLAWVAFLWISAAALAGYAWRLASAEQPAPPANARQTEALEQNLVESGLMAEAEVERMRQEREGRKRELAERRQGRASLQRTVLYNLAGGAAGIGLLIVTGTAWASVHIRRLPSGEIAFAQRQLFGKRRRIEPAAIRFIQYGADERIRRQRRGTVEERWWEWRIDLLSSAREGPPVIRLIPWSQKNPPGAARQAPKSVRVILEWLHRHTGKAVHGPTLVEAHGPRGDGRRPLRPAAGPVQPVPGQAQVRSRRVENIEDLPPELREQARRMQEEARASGKTQRVVINNPDGSHQVYESLEDMPPEMRAFFEDQFRE